jgi:hypothetical protein
MDEERFDRLSRTLARGADRRGALAILAALSAGALTETVDAARRRQRRNARGRLASQAASQCDNPGPGQPLRGCDFSGQDLIGIDWHSAMLRGAKFVDANLCGADLHSAHLRGADFTGANLTRANLKSSSRGAKTDGAIRCRTIMPDGTRDDTGCTGGPVCCTDADCGERQTCTGNACRCQSGFVRLPNGSCGLRCLISQPQFCNVFGPGCTCPRFVESPGSVCVDVSEPGQFCLSTRFCPPGQACDLRDRVCYDLCGPPIA